MVTRNSLAALSDMFPDDVSDVLTSNINGVIHWGSVPPVFGAVGHVTFLQEELDTFEMSLGSGEMERGTSIIIGYSHILVTHQHPSEGSEVPVKGTKQKSGHMLALSIRGADSGIKLFGSVLKVVIVMEVEETDQLLTELDTADTVTASV